MVEFLNQFTNAIQQLNGEVSGYEFTTGNHYQLIQAFISFTRDIGTFHPFPQVLKLYTFRY
jgi:hypothetical protein